MPKVLDNVGLSDYNRPSHLVHFVNFIRSSMNISEELLSAWLQMSVHIRGSRIVSNFSFNETVICGMLARTEEAEGRGMTAAEICRRTHLLKSQVNRTLSSLEARGIILRSRNRIDQREIDLRLTEGGHAAYQAEHASILRLVSHISDTIGEADSRQLAILMTRAVSAADTWFSENGRL